MTKKNGPPDDTSTSGKENPPVTADRLASALGVTDGRENWVEPSCDGARVELETGDPDPNASGPINFSIGDTSSVFHAVMTSSAMALASSCV